MRRRQWAGLAFALALVAGCGVDSYLTCGAPCEDSGGVDATIDSTIDSGGIDANAQDVAVKDAGQDVKDAAVETGCLGISCQGNSGCCTSAPSCNAGHHCATSCGALDASCTQQNGDTCCQASFCNQGHCSACLEAGVTCSEDWQCCGGACVGSSCQ